MPETFLSIDALLERMVARNASDLHITVGTPPAMRVHGALERYEDTPELTVTTAMDLFMLLNVGGKKHTRRGLARLLEAAGLRPDGVEPVPGTTLRAVTAHIPAVGA